MIRSLQYFYLTRNGRKTFTFRWIAVAGRSSRDVCVLLAFTSCAMQSLRFIYFHCLLLYVYFSFHVRIALIFFVFVLFSFTLWRQSIKQYTNTNKSWSSLAYYILFAYGTLNGVNTSPYIDLGCLYSARDHTKRLMSCCCLLRFAVAEFVRGKKSKSEQERERKKHSISTCMTSSPYPWNVSSLTKRLK